MHKNIEKLTFSTIRIASVWGANIGEFRYRIAYNCETDAMEAFTYTGICFEKAKDIESKTFETENQDIEPLKQWLDSQYNKYCGGVNDEIR